MGFFYKKKTSQINTSRLIEQANIKGKNVWVKQHSYGGYNIKIPKTLPGHPFLLQQKIKWTTLPQTKTPKISRKNEQSISHRGIVHNYIQSFCNRAFILFFILLLRGSVILGHFIIQINYCHCTRYNYTPHPSARVIR